ncbi:MAG TPA: methyltransferase domain-containing protein [Thermoanaerobaculia bacterium]|nr:methyltransferase domain-containing protein [Thermoanaerobaculia bacterium]
MSVRLHLGCGDIVLPDWINIDVKSNPGVDRVLDVREGLPFHDVDFIFAEHFLEHFELTDALKLLRDCRSALSDEGVLRLTTPNLDWVWSFMYQSRWKGAERNTAIVDADAWPQDSTAARDCLWLNRSFRGWGHKFLYNAAMLEEVLHRAGFAIVEWCEYGASRHDALRGLEQHEQYADIPAVRHLLIAEASGRGPERRDENIEALVQEYLHDVTLS